MLLPPTRIDVRGVYLWGNHSPTMWPDISRAEAKVRGRWVPVNEGIIQKRGGIRYAAAEVAVAEAGSTAAAAAAAWREWVSKTLVPAVRDR